MYLMFFVVMENAMVNAAVGFTIISRGLRWKVSGYIVKNIFFIFLLRWGIFSLCKLIGFYVRNNCLMRLWLFVLS